MSAADWFLREGERGNPSSLLPAWSDSNHVEPLVHGAEYFDRLVSEVETLSAGDHLFFTDWRGDLDQLLREDGPTVQSLLCGAAERGVIVKGLVWRSHIDVLQFSQAENRRLAEAILAAGGEVLLDQRVRKGGSHHQKLVILRRPDAPERDVAFAGGIDLCHSRRDDDQHLGDPQAVPMATPYGSRPPWHDVQLELRGPVVGALDLTFRERWEDPTALLARRPLAHLRDRVLGARLEPRKLPPRLPDPPPAGDAAVQVLRTYPKKRPAYPFAPQGERSVARGYSKAVQRARSLIYVEDQYLWSAEVADLFAAALRRNPELHMIVVVPRHADVDGRLALPPNLVGRVKALEVCRRAGGDRVHVFDVENRHGTPVYVHAKVCVIDDTWACVGSDNFNRRSWSHDGELSCSVLDGQVDERTPADPGGRGDRARRFARQLRLRLMAEHLDLPDGDVDELLDPATAVERVCASAKALDAWYAGGRVGPRPAGRLREHRAERLPLLTELWAMPVYRLIYDPDGRPWRARRRGEW